MSPFPISVSTPAALAERSLLDYAIREQAMLSYHEQADEKVQSSLRERSEPGALAAP